MTLRTVLFLFIASVIFTKIYYKLNVSEPGYSAEPLLLTPLLEAKNITTAQQQSKVTLKGITSYSGFLTVNKECNSNLFFWFFPAQNDWETAPVLLWLQGGPGSSSMFGLFEEIGPYELSESGLKLRQYSWNVHNNLLFIDQPVGTGYSFTDTLECLPSNETVIGEQLYSAIVQFFVLFPQLQGNKFYVSGESYAGKYIPALGYTIHTNNPSADVKIHLSGLFIGNGYMDPLTQSLYGDYLYQLGLIDDNQLETYRKVDTTFKEALQNEDYGLAKNTLSLIHTMFKQYVGSVSLYNYLKNGNDLGGQWEAFIQDVEMRRLIHVGSTEYDPGFDILIKLGTDEVMSVKPWLETLLEHYDVLFYNGQLDILCGYPMMVKFLRSLNWSGHSVYRNATRYKWTVDGELAGYFKKAGHLMELLVRGAGHMVPSDQHKWAFHMINTVTGVPNYTFIEES